MNDEFTAIRCFEYCQNEAKKLGLTIIIERDSYVVQINEKMATRKSST